MNYNDLEVAHPQSGSSSTWFLVELDTEVIDEIYLEIQACKR